MTLNSTVRQVIFWVVIIVGAILLYRFFRNPSGSQAINLGYSQLIQAEDRGDVETATIEPEKVYGKLKSDKRGYTTELSNDFVARDLTDAMNKKGVTVDFKSS